MLELAEPCAGQLLEGALIEIIQQHADSLIECGQGEEALMAQSCHDPALDDLYRHLGLGFIPGFIQTRRYDDTLVMGIYPNVYLDCIMLKIRQDKRVINKAIYLALGINLERHKELLGLWLAETEGAKFWLSVLTKLQNRGLKEIFIAAVNGLTGFPDAINTIYLRQQGNENPFRLQHLHFLSAFLFSL